MICNWERRRWDGAQAYSDSKLFDAVLACAVARHVPDVLSNAVEPGWVPTNKSPGAPDDLSLAPVTQAWLAVSDEADAGPHLRRVLLSSAPLRHPSRRARPQLPGPTAGDV